MTRAEMVTQFNFYTRKRDCYITKIATNSALRDTLSTSLSNCELAMNNIAKYAHYANIFDQLYTRNNTYFNPTVTSEILGIIDAVGTHLESVKESAQGQINYYDGLIKAYDAEQERLAREAAEAAAAAAEGN